MNGEVVAEKSKADRVVDQTRIQTHIRRLLKGDMEAQRKGRADAYRTAVVIAAASILKAHGRSDLSDPIEKWLSGEDTQ